MDFGGLFTGMTERARGIRKESHDREQQDFHDLMQIGMHIIDSPHTPASMKDEATDMVNQALMTHMYPDQFKPQKNKLHKFVESYLGTDAENQRRGYAQAASQLGVGRGRATTPVVPPIDPSAVSGGGVPPSPMQQMGGPAAQVAPTISDIPQPPPAIAPDMYGLYDETSYAPTMSASAPQPAAPPQTPGTFPQLGQSAITGMKFFKPEDFGFSAPKTSAHGFVEPQDMLDWNRAKEFTAQANLKLIEAAASRATAEAENQVALQFDIPQIGLKKGTKVDKALFPVIDSLIKGSKGSGYEFVTKTNLKGEAETHIIDKDTLKEVSTVNLGSVQDPGLGEAGVFARLIEEQTGIRPTAQQIQDIMAKITGVKAEAAEKGRQAAAGAEDAGAYYGREVAAGRIGLNEVPTKNDERNKTIKWMTDNNLRPPVQLTKEGSTTVAQTQPTLALVQRLKDGISPFKDSNAPLGEAGDRLLYSLGIATDQSGNIAGAELLKVLGAARIMRGSSRSIQALDIAMQHLPNIKKDSGKLMWDKLNTLETNLKDIVNAAFTYEGKYGMVQATPGEGPEALTPAGNVRSEFDEWRKNKQPVKK